MASHKGQTINDLFLDLVFRQRTLNYKIYIKICIHYSNHRSLLWCIFRLCPHSIRQSGQWQASHVFLKYSYLCIDFNQVSLLQNFQLKVEHVSLSPSRFLHPWFICKLHSHQELACLGLAKWCQSQDHISSIFWLPGTFWLPPFYNALL